MGKLRADATLRHAPFGIYPTSVVYIGSGANHGANLPCYNSDVYIGPQYQVNTATGNCRVTIAAGLYNTSCKEIELHTITDCCVYAQGLSSLLLGLSGWVYSSTGLNPMITSGYIDTTALVPPWVGKTLAACTDNLIIDLPSRGAVGIGTQQTVADW